MTRSTRARILFAGVAATATVTTLAATLLDAHPSDASRAKWGIGTGQHASRVTAVRAPAKPTPVKTTPARPTPSATSAAPKPGDATDAAPPVSLPTQPFLGTLVTNADRAATESKAGVKVAMIEFKWAYLEPSRGVYNTKYANSMAALVAKYRAAGMRVTLGLGLHYTPQWALDMSGGRMVNQYGQRSGQIDLVFNQKMRDAANEYLAMIDRAVGLENFWAIRVSSGGVMELMYPSNAYWAYSDGAQNGTTKPSTLAPNPMPGWKPTQPATVAQRDAWARWYVGALNDVADWQMDKADALGFTGYFQILTPGQGVRPKQYRDMINSKFGDGALGRGAVWFQLYAGFAGRKNVTAYVTSVGEALLNSDTCQSNDDSVPITSDATFYWSSSRWITRLAHEYGFTVSGEVPGYSGGSSGTYYKDQSSRGLMSMAMAQMRTCGFQGLYWAHDDQLWNGTSSFDQFTRYTDSSAAAPALAS